MFSRWPATIRLVQLLTGTTRTSFIASSGWLQEIRFDNSEDKVRLPIEAELHEILMDKMSPIDGFFEGLGRTTPNYLRRFFPRQMRSTPAVPTSFPLPLSLRLRTRAYCFWIAPGEGRLDPVHRRNNSSTLYPAAHE
jgi:hypothetical protein